MIDFEITCRYGHGTMQRVSIAELHGFLAFVVPALGQFEHGPGPYLNAGNSVNLYKCTVCTYVELHDRDPEE